MLTNPTGSEQVDEAQVVEHCLGLAACGCRRFAPRYGRAGVASGGRYVDARRVELPHLARGVRVLVVQLHPAARHVDFLSREMHGRPVHR